METKLKIVQKRNLWFTISLVLILIGVVTMSYRALKQQPYLNFGIDFTGGSSFIIKFEELNKKSIGITKKSQQQVNSQFISDIRKVLREFNLDKSQIQITGEKEVIVRTIQLSNQIRVDLLRRLEENLGELELLEVDIIGPTIGAELREQSLWIILVVTIALLLYISWRFEFVFGAAALTAVLHDALIVISIASILGIELNTAFVAAILTVLGYSINDTIVIFDRIRENTHLYQKKWDYRNLINYSIEQMIGRSLHTSLTTLFVIGCLLVIGGTTIKAFALVLLTGIIAGTYSSIFIASPVLYLLRAGDQK